MEMYGTALQTFVEQYCPGRWREQPEDMNRVIIKGKCL
jgi:hypothetical protein